MKKLNTKYIILIIMVFAFVATQAQEKVYCKLVADYTEHAKKVYDNEILITLGAGQELWVKMEPASFQNRKENGGCRLREGDKYVADAISFVPIRALACGNEIIESSFETVTTTAPINSNIYIVCNCPDDDKISDNDVLAATKKRQPPKEEDNTIWEEELKEPAPGTTMERDIPKTTQALKNAVVNGTGLSDQIIWSDNSTTTKTVNTDSWNVKTEETFWRPFWQRPGGKFLAGTLIGVGVGAVTASTIAIVDAATGPGFNFSLEKNPVLLKPTQTPADQPAGYIPADAPG